MSEQEIELNVASVLLAVLKRYEVVEISPETLLAEDNENYQLRVDFNEENKMFRITLEEVNES